MLPHIKVSVYRHTSNSCKCATDADCAGVGSEDIIVSQKDDTCLELPKDNVRDGRCSTVKEKKKYEETNPQKISKPQCIHPNKKFIP